MLKVDVNSFVSDGQQRDSVRVSSVDHFGLGTLWVLDAYHLPYGCRYVAGATTTVLVVITFRPVSGVHTGL